MTYSNFKKELRVIGMIELNGISNSESIKKAIEIIANGYDFDKKKITGVVCDSASYLVRLFRENENYLFDMNTEIEDIQENGFIEGNADGDDDCESVVEINDEDDDEDYQFENEDQNGTDESDVDNQEEEIDEQRADEDEDEDEVEIQSKSTNNFHHNWNEVDQEIDLLIPEARSFMNLAYEYESDSDDEFEENLENESDTDIHPNESLRLLNIQIGTNSVPRYSCSAHKINLAVRSSIKSVSAFVKILSKLSNFASSMRRSTVLSYDFSSKKVKLRCENGTRWSSSYLMLVSFFLAYEKNAFSLENPCPISKNKTY
ncbi:hypothetical protein BpHYR1_037096 [Brachionus plicatilis]|uniref:Uncharacterized protein n=1 Tax=Brachionus plicatilis TaxID=10195 RepID=A0A3M7REI9_BRAPC|nr:hypothetical protein BpHYR1_037096 [Brachionus plicatilis]